MKYLNLLLMSVLSLISMYILMYIMVDKFDNIYSNLNQLYMASIMIIPMLLLELFFMGSMYNNKKVNVSIVISCMIIFILLIIFIRKQVAISDKEFLKSMISHHAAAVLMCKNAALQDPELKELCSNIISTQQYEINLMKAKLKK